MSEYIGARSMFGILKQINKTMFFEVNFKLLVILNVKFCKNMSVQTSLHDVPAQL